MRVTALAMAVCCVIGSTTNGASAQEPPDLEPQQRAALAPPPYVADAPCVPLPDAAQLRHRGRVKEVVGAVLMGLGGGVTALGIGLTIHALTTRPDTPFRALSALSEVDFAFTAIAAGQALMIAGIPVYVVGSVQVDKARRLAGELAIAPSMGPTGVGLMSSYRLRF